MGTVEMETIFNRIVPDSLNKNKNKKTKNNEQKENDKNANDDNHDFNSNGKPNNDSIVPRAKSILIGNDITIPISNGKLKMGTWQGIWLCEHSNNASSRKLIVTINGIK